MNGLFSHGATLPPADFRAQHKEELRGDRNEEGGEPQTSSQRGCRAGTGGAVHLWKEQKKQGIFLLESANKKMTLSVSAQKVSVPRGLGVCDTAFQKRDCLRFQSRRLRQRAVYMLLFASFARF